MCKVRYSLLQYKFNLTQFQDTLNAFFPPPLPPTTPHLTVSYSFIVSRSIFKLADSFLDYSVHVNLIYLNSEGQ